MTNDRMEPERALTIFCAGSPDVDEVLAAQMLAIEALKRRIPQRPRRKKFYFPICPVCSEAFKEGQRPKWCPNCGQALKWDDAETGTEVADADA